MRRTWMSPGFMIKNVGYKTKVVFVLGDSTDSTVNKQVIDEQSKFEDMLKSSFIDSYKNNTYKAISYLK